MANDRDDAINAVRDMALDQMCTGLRNMGIADDKIAAARKQCIDQNSDKPLFDLARPKLRKP